MTFDHWVHVVELIVMGIGLPMFKVMISIGVDLRDVTRDLKHATEDLRRQVLEHEQRLRIIEERHITLIATTAAIQARMGVAKA